MATSRKRNRGGLVWDSEVGAVCPTCSAPEGACACDVPGTPAGDGIVRIELAKKARRGKTVTVIHGLPLAGAALADLARKLKKHCGAGGKADAGTIEIQGDVRDAVAAELTAQGYRVKGGR